MPADMAVHQPGSRVVRDEAKHEISGRRHIGHVAAWRVDEIELLINVLLVLAGAEYVKVVTVQMDRVRHGDGRLDDDVDPLVGARQRNGERTQCAELWRVLVDIKECGLRVGGLEVGAG